MVVVTHRVEIFDPRHHSDRHFSAVGGSLGARVQENDGTHPSQIFLTRVFSCSPWKKMMKTVLYT
ncbi:unnamed protein product [Ixodes persulcatus]